MTMKEAMKGTKGIKGIWEKNKELIKFVLLTVAFVIVTAIAIKASVVWWSVVLRNWDGDKAPTASVETAAPVAPTATPIAPTVTVPVITPVAPATAPVEAAPVEETIPTEATIPENPAISTELVAEPVAFEAPATPTAPVVVPAPVAVSTESVAPAELVTTPTETAVVSEEPVVATVEPAAVATAEPVSTPVEEASPAEAVESIVEFYDANLNRLYINLDSANYDAISGVLESYGNVDLYDYESQERIEM